jgi:transketolase
MIFPELQKQARLRLLKMHFEAKVGHIGGNLSSLDAILYLHHNVMQKEDHFILSKGHAAGALYIALWSVGKISDEQLLTFHKEQTKLAGHPAPNWIAEIPFATGSLGHGLGLACGMSVGNKLQNKKGQIFCFMSDGEWQEGSNFEALVFLNHQQLKNVTVIIDCNGLQGFGTTEEIASLNLKKLYEIFAVFNFEITEINGHEEVDLKKLSRTSNRPQIFLMNTIKGHGVSFMENQMQWHYLPLNDQLYNQAKKEIENL